ncbi:uncharacterized protein LOC120185995 isoform X2 [Hibiscus syriacus]|uniref:uncharacterized protein LOC120185995 isoform X2 n=1 Tax=Hibiscus syriacus TaxID=106335 RepID=UPI00192499FD|nr:uncharacterized protein LOC120185995 isoform X2 [Hibiscus syriacus]
MLGALSAASLTLGPGSAPAPFTAQRGNDGAAKALAFPRGSNSNRAQLLVKSSFTSTSRTAPSFRTAVAAVDSDQLSPEKQAQKYHFVVANAKFMDEEEHFKELLFERLRFYGEHDKEQDFWLLIEPKFLEKFPDITKRLHRPAVALVSTNGPWITFMKLRLDRVLSNSYEADSLEEALASNPTMLEFEKPENWVAPYPKYEFGWWEPFLPNGVKV